ncbi:inner membrane-spanning protein YciB [Thorsellia anophelis]|uniref:Inner membrane-spanning protein YciB n=1 Tax=Thorsellia anophelis DSM 18579 TaxID=1123402 RepID=A0A1I0CKU5_9GAMM|nr:inner membrane-spanning protein YciB [Thorsellia anophelis]SET20086.1 intracellular septation protein [Thorsellia anophelis DSM 18579]
MKSLFKFLPLVIFFVIYKYYDIFLATKVLIGLSIVSVVGYYLVYKQVDKMMLLSNGLLIVFGLLTIKFQDEQFLIWKVSIIYMLIATGLIITTFVTKKSAMQVALKDELTAPAHVWRNINIGMILFLVICSGLNLYVGWSFEFDFWFNFKMFGMPVLLILFFIGQSIYLFKNATMIEKETENSVSDEIQRDIKGSDVNNQDLESNEKLIELNQNAADNSIKNEK